MNIHQIFHIYFNNLYQLYNKTQLNNYLQYVTYFINYYQNTQPKSHTLVTLQGILIDLGNPE